MFIVWTVTVHVNLTSMSEERLTERHQDKWHLLSLVVSGQANDLSLSWVRPFAPCSRATRAPTDTHSDTQREKHSHPHNWHGDRASPHILLFNNFLCTRSAGGWWSVTCPWVFLAGRWHLKVADLPSPATFLSVPLSPVCLVSSSSKHWRQQWALHWSYRRKKSP